MCQAVAAAGSLARASVVSEDRRLDIGIPAQLSFVGQNNAVDRIGHYGQILEATLGKLADAIEQFYVELLATVTTLVSAIVLGVVTIIAAVGVVAIPVGIGTVIGAILSVVAAGLGILAMVLTITQEVNDSLGDLHSNLQPWPSAKFAS